MTLTGDMVSEATTEMQRVLRASADIDWGVAAGDLEWSCWATGAHIADDLFSYASQVLAQPAQGYLPIEAAIEPGAPPAAVLESIAMCGDLLRLAVGSASTDCRAWHPYGTSDPEGFAAMGVVEVLVHTHDIAKGLDIPWEPSAELSRQALDRLFPDAPEGDPAAVLLWCTGRAALGERPRLTQWRWDSSVRAHSTAH